MKKLLLSLCVLTCACGAFGQVKFTGDYLGILIPPTRCLESQEKLIGGMAIYADGSVSVTVTDFEGGATENYDGFILANGRIYLYDAAGLEIFRGKVNSNGNGTGIAYGQCKYACKFWRRFPWPSAPVQ